MKLSGWIFMIVSWTFILSLATFCFSRIFKKDLGGEDKEKPVTTKKKRGGSPRKAIRGRRKNDRRFIQGLAGICFVGRNDLVLYLCDHQG